jgi:hypothetical protein
VSTSTRTRPARPSPQRLAAVREVLDTLPPGGELVLIYGPERMAEAAWLYAQARVAGWQVSLRPVRSVAPAAVERTVRELRVADAAVVVLSEHRLAAPPAGARAALQLAGPADRWRRPDPAPLPTGPDLQLPGPLRLRVALPWRVDDGDGPAGGWRVRPAGTAEAPVEAADGVFVADGAIDVNRAVAWDARLAGRAVTVTVEGGQIVDVTCPDTVLLGFLRRAVQVHRAARVAAVRLGRHTGGGFSAVPGPLNDCHPGVALRIDVDPARAYSAASADLRLDLIATLRKGET